MAYRLLCYIPTPSGLTGAPKRLLTLCQTLRNQDIDAQIVSDPDSQLLAAGKNHGVPSRAIKLKPLLQLNKKALLGSGVLFKFRVLAALAIQNLRFARFVRRENADIVLIRGAKGIAFAALGARLAMRPVIWDVDRELPSHGTVRFLHQLGLSLANSVIFQYYGAGNAIFGSERTRKYQSKLHALIPGTNLEQLTVFKLRRKQRAINNKFKVLQVGTVCDWKNQALTIRAIEEILNWKDMPPFMLQFAGEVFEEEYKKTLLEKIAMLGLDRQVEFLGWRDDIHQLMVGADLLLMPSKDEGVPNAVQEAMYIGLPVIVSNVGGIPEIVQHGHTGWVLPLRDHLRWAEQIWSCAQNKEKCNMVGKAASYYAEKHFCMEAWGKRYAAFVKIAASGGRNWKSYG